MGKKRWNSYEIFEDNRKAFCRIATYIAAIPSSITEREQIPILDGI